MLKHLLFFALLTTQLLAGSGDAVYLCLTPDGDFCCINSELEPCRCPKHRATVECCENEDCLPSVDDESQIGDSDRCTKILLVSASSMTPAGTVGNCPPMQAQSDLAMMSLVETPAILPEFRARRDGSSISPQSIRSALSTIMLRC